MSYLTLAHAQRLAAVLGPLYARLEAPDFPNRLAQAVRGLLGGEIACFDRFGSAGEMEHLGSGPHSLYTPAMLAQLARHVREHPLFGPVFAERRAAPQRLTDYCSVRRFARTTLYEDCYRPLAITHQLIAGFGVPDQGFSTCALSRVRRDFTETDRALLAFLQPHLTALFRFAAPAPAGPAPPDDRPASPLAQLLTPLTRREAEIWQLLAQGLSDKEIAARCGISPRTVQVHAAHLYAKLGVANRTAAARLAPS